MLALTAPALTLSRLLGPAPVEEACMGRDRGHWLLPEDVNPFEGGPASSLLPELPFLFCKFLKNFFIINFLLPKIFCIEV